MKEIALSGDVGFGKHALVDDEDYPLLSRITWSLSSHGYAVNGKCYMHSLILGFPRGLPDHIDRNKLNNQKDNFRFVTSQQNMMNRGRQRNNLTSQYKGVFRSRRHLSNPWVASITKKIDGKQKSFHLGYFAEEVQAARAYDAKASELYGQFAVLNFPS